MNRSPGTTSAGAGHGRITRRRLLGGGAAALGLVALGETARRLAFSPPPPRRVDTSTLTPTGTGTSPSPPRAKPVGSPAWAPFLDPGGWNRLPDVRFTPDSSAIMSIDGTGAVRRWPVRAGGSPQLVPRGTSDAPVNRAAISADARLLALAPSPGPSDVVVIADLRTSAVLARLRHEDAVEILGFTDRGRILVTRAGSEDQGAVHVWDAGSGRRLGPPVQARRAHAVSPDGRLLLATSGTPAVWDVPAHRRVTPVTVPEARTWAVRTWGDSAFSPDGRTLALPASDGRVQWWDVARRAPVPAGGGRPRLGSGDAVCAVAWDPVGRLVAVGGTRGVVKVWDRAARWQVGPDLVTYAEPGADPIPPTALRFAPDGRRLGALAFNGTVSVWLLPG